MVKPKDLKALSLGALPETTPMEAPTLSQAEMLQIEAQAKQEVDEEIKSELRASFLKKSKAALRKKALFVEGANEKGVVLESIYIELPKFSDRITIDGCMYMHGNIYKFAPEKAATIKEVIYRQWMHHAEVKGLDVNEFFGRQKQHVVISPRQATA